MEVPFQVANSPLPDTDEVMDTPGANSVSHEAPLLNEATKSLVSPVAPTLTALDMQPGPDMPSARPLLPAAMTVAMPTELRLSMAALVEELSWSHSMAVV